MNLKISPFPDGRELPTAMVISHERSGTHFLMNALGKAFGYHDSEQRLDLDHRDLPINFYNPGSLAGVFEGFQGASSRTLIKSHHQVDFFLPVFQPLFANVKCLYIHREPVAVFESFWEFQRRLPWRETADTDDPGALARAEPEGNCMRYQMRTHDTMLKRWMMHVAGWLHLARSFPDNVAAIRFEDLRDDYPATIQRIGGFLGASRPPSLDPPTLFDSLVAPRLPDQHNTPMAPEDRMWVTQCAEPVLALRATP